MLYLSCVAEGRRLAEAEFITFALDLQAAS
jgi:hypothetical protein